MSCVELELKFCAWTCVLLFYILFLFIYISLRFTVLYLQEEQTYTGQRPDNSACYKLWKLKWVARSEPIINRLTEREEMLSPQGKARRPCFLFSVLSCDMNLDQLWFLSHTEGSLNHINAFVEKNMSILNTFAKYASWKKCRRKFFKKMSSV